MTDEAAPPTVTLYPGDCLAVLATLPDESVHAVITDPPYGLSDLKPTAVVTAMTAWANGDRDHVPDGRGFMSFSWDSFVPPPAVWDECLRVLKPGGYLAAFAGSRTQDLMGLSIRMAGFEIRDGLQWLYGSGFPKGLDVGKAITATERHGGANSVTLRRSLMGDDYAPSGRYGNRDGGGRRPTGAEDCDVELTENGARWQGWKTALKPSVEPIILARRPLSGTVAATVLAHGTGAINVDACRTGDEQRTNNAGGTSSLQRVSRVEHGYRDHVTTSVGEASTVAGRWPANVLLSHAPLLDEHGEPVGDACADGCVPGCPVAELDGQSGATNSSAHTRHNSRRASEMREGGELGSAETGSPADSGGASRFFPTFRYAAKAPKKERPTIDGKGWPTVKPLGLMQWLARLLCPPGGVILDPFPGTGTTGQAAQREGFESILIERDPFARDLAAVRIPDVVLGAVPISEATCPIHGEHGGTVDCVDCLYPETSAEPEQPVEDAGDIVAASLYAATDVAELHAIRDAVPAEAWQADFDEILAARAVELDPVLSAIAAASSGAELRAVHIEHLAAWSDEYTAALVARVNELAAMQDTVA